MTNPRDPDVDPLREEKELQRTADRNKKLSAFAVAGVTALVLVACGGDGTGGAGEQNATTPASEAAAVSPVKAQEVATGFVEAFGAFDADRAISYLADDADIWPLISAVGVQGAEGTLDEFRLLISMEQAAGSKLTLDSCEEMESSASPTEVRCTFDVHSLGSDEIGLGPYSGNYFALTVRDGEIVQASQYRNYKSIYPQMWAPFATWVATNYPDDVEVMYEIGGHGARLTRESIRLWERHRREYVEEVKQGAA
jgi:hypothetical protein